MPADTIYSYATKSWPIANGCSPNMPCAPRCWAKRTVNRLAHSPNPKVQAAHEDLVELLPAGFRSPAELRWTGETRLNEAHLTDPLHWRTPQRVAVAYHGDLFRLPFEEIDRVFAVMALCPQHTFLTLTKVPERMREYCVRLQQMADDWLEKLCAQEPTKKHSFTPSDVLNMRWMHGTFGRGPAFPYGPWPLPNWWSGVSCSNQPEADERITALLQTPAAKRWLSLEPLIGPIVLPSDFLALGKRAWCVVGCESGPHARPMQLDWVRSIAIQCLSTGVPFYFKQAIIDGRKIELPELDGETWCQMPEVARAL